MLGGHSLKNRDTTSFAAVPIKHFIIHPKASDFTLNKVKGNWDLEKSELTYDYAIIVLQSEVMLTKHIQPICLPPTQPILINFYDNQLVYASGWGDTELIRYGTGPTEYTYRKPTYFPKRANLKIVPITECAQNYSTTIYEKAFEGHELKLTLFCALGVKYNTSFVEDTCKGDSGGTTINE